MPGVCPPILPSDVGQGAGGVTRRPIVIRASAQHAELHGITGFQRGAELGDIRGGVHRLAVDGDDHVARLQADVIGEGTGLHRLHLHTALLLDSQAIGLLLGQVLDLHTEFGGGRFAVGRRILRAIGVLLGEELRAVGHYHLQVVTLALALHRNGQRGADRRGGHGGDQLVAVGDGLAVDGGNDVAVLHAGLLAGAARDYLGYEYAFFDARHFQVRARLVGVARCEVYADGAADDFAVLDDVVVDLRRHVDGQGEADALVSAVARGDGGIDADELAADVQQRAAAIAGVDGGVGLQEMRKRHGRVHIALLGADDARRDGGLIAERRTDGNGPIAHLHGVGIAHLGHGQVLLVFHADHRQVRGGVHAHHLGIIFHRIVVELHADAIRLVHHVVVGQNVAGAIHHHARTGGLTAALLHLGTAVAEEAVEQILH